LPWSIPALQSSIRTTIIKPLPAHFQFYHPCHAFVFPSLVLTSKADSLVSLQATNMDASPVPHPRCSSSHVKVRVTRDEATLSLLCVRSSGRALPGTRKLFGSAVPHYAGAAARDQPYRVVVKKANHLLDSRWWLAYDMILHTRCTEKDGLLLFTFCDLMDTYDIIEAQSERTRYVVSLS
jgi:hypothetical protein